MATSEHDSGRHRTGRSIGNHNFDAQSHRQLYDKIHGGPGYSAAQAVDDAWAKFLDVMRTARVELETTIRRSGAVWQGAAGERFTSSNAPLVQWAEDACTAATVTRASFEAQALSYVDAKGEMPEPVKVTSTANDDLWGIPAGFTHLVGGQTDQDLQEAQAQEAKRLAVAVMIGYRERASAAVDSLGEFVPPPSVTTQMVEPPAVERHGVETTGTARQERPTTSEGEAPGSVEPSGGAVTEGREVGRTATSAATTPQEALSRLPPGQATLPQHAPAPPATAPVGIAPPGNRPPATRLPTHTPTGRPGGSSEKAGSGVMGGMARGAGGRGTKPLSPGVPGGGVTATPPGSGGSTGVGDDTRSSRTNAAAARATAGSPPPAAGLAATPQAAKGEDDLDHRTAPYLEELDDVWGADSIPRVAPPVIGEDDR
ncbi:hypothetical protein F4560_008472 [Saccharothrix ecbatanensis]|uniref:PPE domain-containing protein n=1 Tax=Saccharothrix ecbatanensis TaxID=1105145 RepID=A0A7W9HVD6_9PSEU|nr:PPE domain-containing protein [Saccharothrix ecbatanensis]MBB5808704.1 hypothetical protein [Saccharothrix ecbatanensis]